MMRQKLIGLLVALSVGCGVASAQTAASKPKQTTKAPAAAQPAPKPPEPPAALPPAPPPPPSDVEVHTKYVTGAQISENTTYLNGARQRFEFPGITMISQCDLKRSVQLHDATRRYLIVPSDAPAPVSATPPAALPDSGLSAAQLSAVPGGRGDTPAQPQGGVINQTITLTDTGERKQLFGLESRRIRTVVIRRPGPNACDTKVRTLETDGWYTDLPAQPACPSLPAQAPPPSTITACTDQVVTQESGSANLGFALSTVVTTTVVDSKADEKEQAKDKEVAIMSMEVTDLQVKSLDPALFEVPPDYVEVKDYNALLPTLATGGSLSDAVFGSIKDGTSAVAPRKEGVIRVGVVTPTNRTGKEMPDLRLVGSLLSGFTKQPFEALPLYGATPVELDRDAAAKACDYVLVSDIAELKTSKPNRVGGLLKKVSGDGSTPSEIHEVRIDYKLFAVGDSAKPKVASTVKASSGGGFGFGSAMRLAYFAGTMYMTMGMGGGMGGMGGMMGVSGLLGQGAPIGGLAGGMTAARMNPGMGAAMSIMSAGASSGMFGELPPGMSSEALSQKALEIVHEGLAKASRLAAEDLNKGKSSSERK